MNPDIVIAAAVQAPSITAGHIAGSVGSGGLAFALTGYLWLGTRDPIALGKKGGGSVKGGGGAKATKARSRLDSDTASVMGIAAGTLYSAAGEFWQMPADFTLSITESLTQNGGFGDVRLGAVSLLYAFNLKFRERTPGWSAVLGVAGSAIWGQAGGIWGLPQFLVLTLANALGLLS